ncbi:MAG: DUF3576 domain-containing protein [Pseudomonadota bacterium]
MANKTAKVRHMSMRFMSSILLGSALALSACSSGGSSTQQIVEEIEGGVNPYLWRASLDTLRFLPLEEADPYGGIINFDWLAFEETPNQRVKASVFILDTRLRADGVKVSVFRQTRDETGEWQDAGVSTDTQIQLENKILERARVLKASEIG